jgi:two-component sensor histidine kinase
LTVADNGAGLPSDFDARQAKGLGMRIVRAFAGQLGADLQVRSRLPGAEFALVVPIEGDT